MPTKMSLWTSPPAGTKARSRFLRTTAHWSIISRVKTRTWLRKAGAQAKSWCHKIHLKHRFQTNLKAVFKSFRSSIRRAQIILKKIHPSLRSRCRGSSRWRTTLLSTATRRRNHLRRHFWPQLKISFRGRSTRSSWRASTIQTRTFKHWWNRRENKLEKIRGIDTRPRSTLESTGRRWTGHQPNWAKTRRRAPPLTWPLWNSESKASRATTLSWYSQSSFV